MSQPRSGRWSSPCPPGHIRPSRPGSRKPGRGSTGPFASRDLTGRELSSAHPKGARSIPSHVAKMGEPPERSVGGIWETAESFGAQPFVTFWDSRRLYSYDHTIAGIREGAGEETSTCNCGEELSRGLACAFWRWQDRLACPPAPWRLQTGRATYISTTTPPGRTRSRRLPATPTAR